MTSPLTVQTPRRRLRILRRPTGNDPTLDAQEPRGTTAMAVLPPPCWHWPESVQASTMPASVRGAARPSSVLNIVAGTAHRRRACVRTCRSACPAPCRKLSSQFPATSLPMLPWTRSGRRRTERFSWISPSSPSRTGDRTDQRFGSALIWRQRTERAGKGFLQGTLKVDIRRRARGRTSQQGRRCAGRRPGGASAWRPPCRRSTARRSGSAPAQPDRVPHDGG